MTAPLQTATCQETLVRSFLLQIQTDTGNALHRSFPAQLLVQEWQFWDGARAELCSVVLKTDACIHGIGYDNVHLIHLFQYWLMRTVLAIAQHVTEMVEPHPQWIQIHQHGHHHRHRQLDLPHLLHQTVARANAFHVRTYAKFKFVLLIEFLCFQASGGHANVSIIFNLVWTSSNFIFSLHSMPVKLSLHQQPAATTKTIMARIINLREILKIKLS